MSVSNKRVSGSARHYFALLRVDFCAHFMATFFILSLQATKPQNPHALSPSFGRPRRKKREEMNFNFLLQICLIHSI